LLRDLRQEENTLKISAPRWRRGIAIHAWLTCRPALYHFLTGLVISVLHKLGRKRGSFRSLPFADGWADQRDFPSPQAGTFMQQYKASVKNRDE
jgi:L-lactate dehydrogenase complex protein LldF